MHLLCWKRTSCDETWIEKSGEFNNNFDSKYWSLNHDFRKYSSELPDSPSAQIEYSYIFKFLKGSTIIISSLHFKLYYHRLFTTSNILSKLFVDGPKTDTFRLTPFVRKSILSRRIFCFLMLAHIQTNKYTTTRVLSLW